MFADKATLVWNEAITTHDAAPIYSVEFRKDRSQKWKSYNIQFTKTKATVDGTQKHNVTYNQAIHKILSIDKRFEIDMCINLNFRISPWFYLRIPNCTMDHKESR